MKRMLILSVLSLTLLTGCNSKESAVEVDIENPSIIPVEVDLIISANDTSITEIPVQNEASEKKDIQNGDEETINHKSLLEILPSVEALPAELTALFYENSMFNYVYLDFEADTDITPRRSLQTTIEDFNYDYFGEELSDDIMKYRDYNVYWQKYTILDLDNDGNNELIYYLFQGGDGFYIIFHVIDGEVYGYSESYNTIDNLYKDGVIQGFGGAEDWWFERIESFEKDRINSIVLAEHSYDYCVIEGNEVSEQEFSDYTAKWGGSDCAVAVEWISAD